MKNPDPSPAPPPAPPMAVRHKIINLMRQLMGAKPKSEALRVAVQELIEEIPSTGTGERMLLGNILKLREKRVIDCMQPRADIEAAEVQSNLQELVELMSAHGHSRIPIYRGTLDDILGFVHMKDIMACLAGQQSRSVLDLIRPILFTAPSTPILKLLLQMRQTRQHMALVVDEYGGIDGLITIEDLVEEIVGDIEDEHDTPAVSGIISRGEDSLVVDGRMDFAEFCDRIGLKDKNVKGAEDIETLGGYVIALAGRMPHLGEIIRNPEGLDFEILDMEQSRIKTIRVTAKKHS